MTIYVGKVSHKPSSDHLAGDLRIIDGATDDSTLAEAFGKSGQIGSISNNGKVLLIDLLASDNGIFYADLQEMNSQDDLNFINDHLSLISNWNALARFLQNRYLPNLQAALSDIDLNKKYNQLSNASQVAVVKYYFGKLSKAEAKEIVNSEKSDRALSDTLGRMILNQQYHVQLNVHGMEIMFNIKTKHFDMVDDQHINIHYFVRNGKVIGSIQQLKSFYLENQKKQFKFFKHQTALLIAQHQDDNFMHQCDLSQNSQDILSELHIQIVNDFKTIKKQLNQSLLSLDPHEIGLSEFEEYNQATAVSAFWRQLKLPFSDIDTSSINFNAIQKWYTHQISFEECVAINQHVLISKLKKAVAKRFNPANVNFDSYGQQVFEELKDDNPKLKYEQIQSEINRAIPDSLEENQQKILDQMKDINSALEIYHQSNAWFDHQVINDAKSKVKIQQDDQRLHEFESIETLILPTLMASTLSELKEHASQKHIEINITRLNQITNEFSSRYIKDVMEQIQNELEDNTSQLAKTVMNRVIAGLKSQIDSYFDDLIEDQATVDRSQEIKNKIAQAFNDSLSNRNGVLATTLAKLIKNKLDSLMVSDDPFTVSQTVLIQRCYQNIVNDIQNKIIGYINSDFENISQMEDVNDIILEFINNVDLNALVNIDFPSEKIINSAFYSIANDLTVETARDVNEIKRYLTSNYPGTLINQFNNDDYQKAIDDFADQLNGLPAKEDDQNDELVYKVKSIMKGASFAVLINGGDMPDDIETLGVIVDLYSDNDEFIDINYDNLKNSLAYKDYQEEFGVDATESGFYMWLRKEPIEVLLWYLGKRNAVVLTPDDIKNYYRNK